MTKTIAIVALAFLAGAAFAADDPPTLRSSGAASSPGPEASASAGQTARQDWWKPYSPPCVERENVFEFTEKPAVKSLGNDKYEITFAVKANCDVTAGIVDSAPSTGSGQAGVVVRHLGSGVLGSNAPLPFQKNSLKQTIYWNGKDDLDVYVKEPGRCRVSVRLGLKPVFERLMGVSDPRNLPGVVMAVAACDDGVYVFSYGSGSINNLHLRKFDHDGNYVMSLAPPPSNLPKEKLGGRTAVEYERGKFAHFGPDLYHDLGYEGSSLPGFTGLENMQPVIVGRRIIYCTAGANNEYNGQASKLHYVYTDGSTDVKGMAGIPFAPLRTTHLSPRLAASPDGRCVYMSGIAGNQGIAPVVMRFGLDGDEKLERFAGDMSSKGHQVSYVPGSDNAHLNNPSSIDCDSQGRVYVADSYNNRVQVFSADGKHQKTILVSRPGFVGVHKKTGGIYVFHSGEVRGRSVPRLTKFTSFDKPDEEFYVDGITLHGEGSQGDGPTILGIDSWSAKPRIWVSNRQNGMGITIWEEDGKTMKRVLDFDEAWKKTAGDGGIFRWSGGIMDHVNCDPVREQLYFRAFRDNPWIFDLRTGKQTGRLKMPSINDISFDKKGYMHVHLDPGFCMPAVVRMDPSQAGPFRDMWGVHKELLQYPEVPYDYGLDMVKPQVYGCIGGIPVKDQPGAKFFQDGFGVNMMGEVAVESNIYYIPRMDDESFQAAFSTRIGGQASGRSWFCDSDPRAAYLKSIGEKLRRGEEIYSIARKPGIPLAGGTVWTYMSNGELSKECAVIAASLIVGLQMDEDGYVYFSNERPRVRNAKPFLLDSGSNYGTNAVIDRENKTPKTSTFMKTKAGNVRWMLKNALIPADPLPDRPHDLGGECWVEGDVAWMYAGLSPNAGFGGCTCPATRFHLDWFKRSYIPEGYRRSIGILDTNGNLIMHLGRYGNYDDLLRMKPGSEDIALTLARFISGTDNYLAFDDWGEGLIVLKLNYHAEETAGIGEVMSAK